MVADLWGVYVKTIEIWMVTVFNCFVRNSIELFLTITRCPCEEMVWRMQYFNDGALVMQILGNMS